MHDHAATLSDSPIAGLRSRLAAVERLRPFLDRCEDLSRAIVALLVMALGLVMGLQILNRYLLKLGLPWTQEVALLCLTWITFLGASVAVRRHAHFAVTMLLDVLGERARRALRLAIYLLMSVLAGVFLIYGIQFAEMGLGRLSSAMEIRMIWFYTAIPISAALMILYLVERVCVEAFPAEPDTDHDV
jgi:TRAP-type C4-dicarboxylate transport system permease small subunit